MNTALRSNICCRGAPAPASTNCGMKARKKMVSLGLSTLSSTALTTIRQPETPPAAASTASAERSRQVHQAM